MQSFSLLSKDEKKSLYESLLKEYESEKGKGYQLDMSRGKPDAEQLDLSMPMLSLNPESIIKSRKGTDTRNYGELAGIDEARELFAELLGLKPENIIVGGNASLCLMYDAIVKALLLGVYGGSKPWGQQGPLKFLCPAPGYDRHFAISQQFGMELVLIPMTPEGPDMGLVKQYVESDPSVKGIWCVPKYSNPQGYTYSDKTVRAFAALKPAADDFRIFWDNAYIIHDHGVKDDCLLNIFDACKEYGSEDMVYEFMSTSKMTFSGSGVSVMAASENNIQFLLKQLGKQTIGYDKINQLRHVAFFKDVDGIRAHMKKHAALLLPKFRCVLDGLSDELGGLEIGDWTRPNGGYFVSFDGLTGTAKRVVSLCAEAGVKLTGAGAAFPYGKDPEDRNIRIAPSYVTVEQLKLCVHLFCLCEKIAALEILMN